MVKEFSLSVLVVDDNHGFAQLIQLMLHEMGITDIQIAENYEQGLCIFRNTTPDVCLIDIDLGKEKKNGIELVEEIRLTHPQLPVIYLTANYTDEYYERCKYTRPSSFMNKELSRLKLRQAIELAFMQTERNKTKQALHSPDPVAPPPYINSSHYFFKIGDVYKSIPIDQIAFFFAEGKMTFARVEKRNFPTNIQLKILEEELYPQFLRVHKSYLVNVNHILQISTKDDKVMVGEEQIPIGYSHRKNFFDHLKLIK